ncbi:MAG TPA: hypothetical protein VJB16_00990, partial [archaeon]|nr:hypothetical protein [archaeon]
MSACHDISVTPFLSVRQDLAQRLLRPTQIAELPHHDGVTDSPQQSRMSVARSLCSCTPRFVRCPCLLQPTQVSEHSSTLQQRGNSLRGSAPVAEPQRGFHDVEGLVQLQLLLQPMRVRQERRLQHRPHTALLHPLGQTDDLEEVCRLRVLRVEVQQVVTRG